MLAAAARYAESRGVRVAWGWGWPDEGAPGYWPWVQVMRSFGLDIPWPGPARQDTSASGRFQLFDEVASLLFAESRIQPLLVLLDDLQWADQPSQLLLDFVARRLPAGAVAVVGSYRDVDPVPGPLLAALAGRTTVLPLTGLGIEAVTQLVAEVVGEHGAAGLAARVHGRTGGNPFFVQQVSWLLQGGQGGIPPGVREALDRRFAALPADCAAALRTAAVTGQRFSADLVARVAGESPEAVADSLTSAVRARVVNHDSSGGYRFAHDLFREYAYDQVPAADRARLHQRVGRQLEAERARGGDVSLAELASHFVQADPEATSAWRYSVEAAREATARLAYEEAVRLWEHAVVASSAAAAGAGPAGRIEAMLELAEARQRAGQGQDAGQAYLRAAELARTGQDPARLARAALGLHAIGTRAWWPPDQVVALLSEALDALGSGSGAGEPLTLARCLLAQHHAIWAAGTARDRLRIAAEVALLAERSGDQEILLEARLLAATDRLELADPGFRAELDEFIRLAEASRQPRFRYAALIRRATLALLAGRLEETGQLIAQAEILGEECGEPGVRDVRYDQGWDLLTAQGRLGELAGTLPQMFPDPESTQARGARAQVLIAAGARDEAAEVVAPLVDRGPEVMPANHQRLIGLAYAAEVTAALGIVPAAEKIYLALEPFAGQAVVSGVAVTFKGAVAHHLGVLAAALGRTAAAASHLEQAVATHDRLGAVTWSLRSQYELARLRLDQPGRREAAVSALAEVARKARALGLAQLARDAEAAGFAGGQVPVTEGVFVRDGAMWSLSYGGVSVRMRDAKGLSDLAVLLAAPGRQVPAAELIAAAGAGRAGLADLRLGADEVLDATARRQIRDRLASLGEDIAEAESWNDPERAARARAERDALLRELTAAAGPAGQPRLLGDQSERARKAVTARIRDVMARIERVHPALAGHLMESVTTGVRCSYSPPTPVSWRL